MKNIKLSSLLFVLAIFGLSTSATAQNDDLYYNPDADTESTSTTILSDDDYYDDVDDNTYASDDYGYDSDYASEDYDNFNEYDDYDYYYSSRIRRFSRPYSGFGFYDPCYVGTYNYTPYGSYIPYGGNNIYITVGNYGDYRRFRRAQFSRNRYNYFNNPFFGATQYGYNPYNAWGNNYGYGYGNSYGYNPYSNNFGYGFSGASGYGYGNPNNDCLPWNYNNNNANVNLSNNNPGNGSSYGPRTNGSINTNSQPVRTIRENRPGNGGSETRPNTRTVRKPSATSPANTKTTPRRTYDYDRSTKKSTSTNRVDRTTRKTTTRSYDRPSRSSNTRTYSKPNRSTRSSSTRSYNNKSSRSNSSYKSTPRSSSRKSSSSSKKSGRRF